jgi:hypothetical protein
MKLISADGHLAQGEDLGSLWRQAENIGRIEVDHPFGSKDYRVQIRFTLRSGSTVWAQGLGSIIEIAMSLAIHEAKTLGGGV